MRSILPGLPVVLLAALAACGTADSGPSEAAVRDSAGVTIVENRAPAWDDDERWRVAPEPVLEIGASAERPELEFHRIVAARRHDDGRIAVADAGSREIRVFGPDGQFLHAAGGEGDAPGEFRVLTWMGSLPGGFILAVDAVSSRLTLFTPEGALQRVVTLTSDGFGATVAAPPLGTGELVVVTRAPRPVRRGRSPGTYRDSLAFLRYAPAGTLRDTVGVFPGPEYAIVEGGAVGVVPYGRTTVHAVSGNRIHVGTQTGRGIEVYDPRGVLRRIVRLPGAEEALEPGDREAWLEALMESRDLSPEARRRVMEEYLDRVPFPPRRPAYSDLLADDSGHLWVGEYALPARDPDGWRVLDPEGRLLGTVRVPHGFRPLDIDDHHVLGRWTDSLGVQRIRVHGLVKPGEGP